MWAGSSAGRQLPMINVMVTTTHAPTRDRRPARDRLLERDSELAVLEQSLNGRGAGNVVFVEAPVGGGKSLLLRAAAEIASDSRMRVMTAAGNELEREFQFGLAIQLFEPLWLTIEADRGEELLHGPAELAAGLLTDRHVDRSAGGQGGDYSVIHSLFWATKDLASCDQRTEGLAILIDDAHRADGPSLRFLAYLAERAAGQPIAIVVSATPGEPCADPRALATLRHLAAGELLTPAPLNGDAVARVVRRSFPDADSQSCASCGRVSGGNPFLLTELLAAMAGDEQAAEAPGAHRVAEMVPDGVRAAVAAQLDSMAPTTRTVAEAIAVFGDNATVRRIARLTDLDSKAVVTAADELAAKQVVAPGIPPSFLQPMVGTAIGASLAPFERAHAHLGAARILSEQRAGADLVAAHLLDAPPDDDPAAVAVLREAAVSALQKGEPDRAVRLLERALIEHPEQAVMVELLAALANAEAEAGRPDAIERLGEAWRISEHPERRAELALAHGHALCGQGRFRAAAEALSDGLAELDGEGELAVDLNAAYVAAAALVPELRSDALAARGQLMADRAGGLRPLARAALAHTCVLDALQGASCERLAELAELSWGDGALLESHESAPLSLPLLAAGLMVADELEWATEICDAALDPRRDDELPPDRELVACAQAWILYEQGRLNEAEAVANSALDGLATRADLHVRSALAVLARCHIEGGRLEQAATVLGEIERHGTGDPVSRALVLEIRAHLRLAEHRPAEALRDAMQAGRTLGEQFPDANPGAIPWRSRAALAHLALGQAEEARELVEQELELARRIGVTRIVVRDLRILGLALGGEGGDIEKLAEAVALGASQPSRFDYVRALIDYGAALRRANRRRDAREPLRLGLDLSHRGGAELLESRARAELIAAGGRPRRPLVWGINSLTASQRRVAELAAAGLTTRQIAGSLFVTPKTVEFHLRQAYQKLEVGSREELARRLAASAGA